jgi:hypothetical protein
MTKKINSTLVEIECLIDLIVYGKMT